MPKYDNYYNDEEPIKDLDYFRAEATRALREDRYRGERISHSDINEKVAEMVMGSTWEDFKIAFDAEKEEMIKNEMEPDEAAILVKLNDAYEARLKAEEEAKLNRKATPSKPPVVLSESEAKQLKAIKDKLKPIFNGTQTEKHTGVVNKMHHVMRDKLLGRRVAVGKAVQQAKTVEEISLILTNQRLIMEGKKITSNTGPIMSEGSTVDYSQPIPKPNLEDAFTFLNILSKAQEVLPTKTYAPPKPDLNTQLEKIETILPSLSRARR